MESDRQLPDVIMAEDLRPDDAKKVKVPKNHAAGFSALGKANQAMLDGWITNDEIMFELRCILETHLGLNGDTPREFQKAFTLLVSALNRGSVDGKEIEAALKPLDNLKHQRRREYLK